MERGEFLKLLGTGTSLACLGCLGACDDRNSYPAVDNVNFTLDLTSGEAIILQSVGGSMTKNGVILARTSADEFIALSRSCSHLGAPLKYDPTTTNFICTRHYAHFDKNGYVLSGPASFAQRKYKTELNGNNLRVYSY